MSKRYVYLISGGWKKGTTSLPTYQTYSFAVNHQYCCWCVSGPFCSFDHPIKCFMVCAKLLYIDQSAGRDMAAAVLLYGCNGTFIASGMADVLYEMPGEEYGITAGGTRIYLGTLMIYSKIKVYFFRYDFTQHFPLERPDWFHWADTFSGPFFTDSFPSRFRFDRNFVSLSPQF